MSRYKLPPAVYKRVIWTVKDYYRRKAEYNAIINASPPPPDGQPRGTSTGDPTGERAVKIASISRELKAVEKALQIMPEEYRKGVWEFILYRKPFPDYAHVNTYKRWKQRFIYQLANLLEL